MYSSIPGLPDRLFQTVYNCVFVNDVCVRATTASGNPTNEGQRLFNAIMVATMESHKDHETLLRSVVMVRKQRPNFRLRLVGDGSLRSHLEQLSSDLGLTETVQFLGSRRDIPEILGKSDLFVLSTTAQEGFGSVLLEALAASLPIVASDVPACREVLQDGRWGFLVEPGNSNRLAGAILAIIERWKAPEAQEVREYLNQFLPQQMVQSYLKIAFQSCVPQVGTSSNL